MGLISPEYLVYYPPYVWNMSGPQLWRLATSFLLSSPRLGIILDPFFLYKYASDVELQLFSRLADICVFFVFIASVIIALNTYFFAGTAFISPLVLALAYYWTAFQPPEQRVSFFIATFPVKFLPWVMLAMNFVQGGNVWIDLTGLVAAHAYLFVTEIWPHYGGGTNMLKPVADWVHVKLGGSVDGRPPPIRRVVPARDAGVRVGGAPGASGNFFGGRQQSWGHRGQGHRLGE